MDLPSFVLRKLYERGSLRETSPGHFRFTLRNPLGPATLVAPPRITVNGITHPPAKVHSKEIDVAGVSQSKPFRFGKGDTVTLRLPGSLLRGGNHIEVVVQTKEFGELRIEAEDNCAEFCDVTHAEASKAQGAEARPKAGGGA